MIKGIIFDLGGVVLTNDWSKEYTYMNQEIYDCFNISETDTLKAWNIHWQDFKIGKLDENEFWKRLLIEAGAKNIDVTKCKEIWKKHQQPINGLLELIPCLKPNYRIAALANISKEGLDYKVERFELNNYFDIIIGSGKCGLAKPDKRIYILALQKINLAPQECVFIDNKLSCLQPAKELGIETILFKSKEQLIEELKQYGVKF